MIFLAIKFNFFLFYMKKILDFSWLRVNIFPLVVRMLLITHQGIYGSRINFCGRGEKGEGHEP